MNDHPFIRTIGRPETEADAYRLLSWLSRLMNPEGCWTIVEQPIRPKASYPNADHPLGDIALNPDPDAVRRAGNAHILAESLWEAATPGIHTSSGQAIYGLHEPPGGPRLHLSLVPDIPQAGSINGLGRAILRPDGETQAAVLIHPTRDSDPSAITRDAELSEIVRRTAQTARKLLAYPDAAHIRDSSVRLLGQHQILKAYLSALSLARRHAPIAEDVGRRVMQWLEQREPDAIHHILVMVGRRTYTAGIFIPLALCTDWQAPHVSAIVGLEQAALIHSLAPDIIQKVNELLQAHD